MRCRIRQQDDAAAEPEATLQPLHSLSSINLNVGVLHYTPGQEPFPLLSDPANYLPDTTDLTDRAELEYWVNGLAGHIPLVVEKAISTDGNTTGRLPPSSPLTRAVCVMSGGVSAKPPQPAMWLQSQRVQQAQMRYSGSNHSAWIGHDMECKSIQRMGVSA